MIEDMAVLGYALMGLAVGYFMWRDSFRGDWQDEDTINLVVDFLCFVICAMAWPLFGIVVILWLLCNSFISLLFRVFK